jgi:hypothetical protein
MQITPRLSRHLVLRRSSSNLYILRIGACLTTMETHFVNVSIYDSTSISSSSLRLHLFQHPARIGSCFPSSPWSQVHRCTSLLDEGVLTKVNLGLLVLNCVYSLSSLDIDPVVVEVRFYTHDSAASVYLNINTAISDTGLSLSFRVIGAVGYIY